MTIPQIIRNIILSAAPMLLVLLAAKNKNRTPSPFLWYSLGVLCFTVCMAVVFSLTGVSPVSGFHTDIVLDRINLIPFNGISRIVSRGFDGYAMRNIAGNLLMFAPLGFFAPLLCPRLKNPLLVLALGAGVSLGIECTQLFLLRGTDIDDLILNTVGTLLGYLFFALCRWLFPRLGYECEDGQSPCAGLIFSLGIIIPYLFIILLGLWDRAVYLHF